MTRYTLATSIFNRITGVVMSVGMILLVYWLMAVASGSQAYLKAHEILSAAPVKIIYAGLLVAFCYHLVAGIRHLVWDTGTGMERETAKRSAGIVIAVTLVLVLALGYGLFVVAAGGHAQ